MLEKEFTFRYGSFFENSYQAVQKTWKYQIKSQYRHETKYHADKYLGILSPFPPLHLRSKHSVRLNQKYQNVTTLQTLCRAIIRSGLKAKDGMRYEAGGVAKTNDCEKMTWPADGE